MSKLTRKQALELVRAAVGRAVPSREEPGVEGVVSRCPKTYRYYVRVQKENGSSLYEYDNAEQLAEAWQLVDLESANAELTKRVAELEAQNEDLFQQNANMAGWCEEKNQLLEDLQSQLEWTPVSKGLPTEDGAYEFVDMLPGGKVRMFDLWVRRDGSWRHNPEEHWDYTHYRRIELPEGV